MSAPRAAAILLLASACAAARPPDPVTAPPAPAGTAARPCGPYGDEAPVQRSAFEARAWNELSERLRSSGVRLRPSGALDRAARALAAGAADGAAQPLARGRVQLALREAGAFDPAPTAHLVSGQPDETLAALLARAGTDEVTHAGIGERRAGASVHVVLLLARRRARLDRFPGALSPGADARLQGELLGLVHPRAFVTRPDGASEEIPLQGGREFSTALRFARPGLHQVEIVGTGDRGPAVAALLSVAVGGAPCGVGPEAAPAPAAAPAPEPADPRSAEAAVVEAANRTRAAHGLPALIPSDAIIRVARAHSERMLAARAVAHVLGREGDLADRLTSAKVPFRHAYENVASAATALEAHAATEESPAHRANLLSADASLIGVGVARGALPTGEAVTYLTEILVEPPRGDENERLTLDARVREAIWRERARRGLPPLTNDLTLEAIAREAAATMRARDSGEVEGIAEAALKAGRKLAAADAFIARAPDEALRSRNLTDARFRRVGVGVVTGDSRRFGPARLFIAVVYGD